MSRSIHTTRRDIEEAKKAQYADSQRRAEEINKLRDELKKKQRIKYRVSSERKDEIEHQFVTPPESIPIQIRDSSDFVHYPASSDDLLGVMRLLPAGVLDGLGAIELMLGGDEQTKEFDSDTPDPLTGRLGIKTLPGIYSGRCLGIYKGKLNRISLFAYVYDRNSPNMAMWEVYIRLQMLSTFIHEIAHHYDFTMRTARDRWLMDDKDKAEIYAETVQHEWVQNYVIPYLQQVYPKELHELDTWITHYGGISIPLTQLAGDPRSTTKGDLICVFGGIPGSFHSLAKDVVEGKSLIDTRIGFARDLHYNEYYTEAMKILDKVLGSEPENIDAITLKADIYNHEEKYDLALPLIKTVLAVDKTYLDAWHTMADICESRCDWEGVLTATDYIIDNFELYTLDIAFYLLDHACANKELGNIADMEIDLADVKRLDWADDTPTSGNMPSYIQRRVDELRGQPTVIGGS